MRLVPEPGGGLRVTLESSPEAGPGVSAGPVLQIGDPDNRVARMLLLLPDALLRGGPRELIVGGLVLLAPAEIPATAGLPASDPPPD